MNVLVGLGVELHALPRVEDLVARDVGCEQRFHDGLGLGGLGAVEGVGQHEGRREAAGGVLTHRNVVLLLVHLRHLAHHGLFLGQVQRKGGTHVEVVAVGLDRRQIVGLDVAGHVEKALGHQVHLFEGLGEKDGVGDVGGVHDHIRLGRDDLAHFARHVARVGRVGDVGHDLVAELLGILALHLGHVGAELGVFVDQRDGLDLLALLGLEVLQKLELVAGHGPVMGRDAEEVGEVALGQGGRGGVRTHVGDLQPLGRLAGGLGDRALVGADQGHHVLLGDQAFGLGQAVFGVALGVGVDDLDLGAAQVGDAFYLGEGQVQVILAVDDLDRQVDAALAVHARGGQVAGQGVKRADLDHLLLGQDRAGSQRQGHAENYQSHYNPSRRHFSSSRSAAAPRRRGGSWVENSTSPGTGNRSRRRSLIRRGLKQASGCPWARGFSESAASYFQTGLRPAPAGGFPASRRVSRRYSWAPWRTCRM